MSWEVQTTKKVKKSLRDLNPLVADQFAILLFELKTLGPVRGNWKGYSKLAAEKHHCHIKDGRPSYVVCWEVINKKIRIMEVYYVGTREKAPY